MWDARGLRSAKTFESGASEESTLLNLLAFILDPSRVDPPSDASELALQC